MRSVTKVRFRRAAGGLACAALAAIFKPSVALAEERESSSVLVAVTATVVRPVVINYEVDVFGNLTVNISNSDRTNITTSMRAAQDVIDDPLPVGQESRHEILVVTVEY